MSNILKVFKRGNICQMPGNGVEMFYNDEIGREIPEFPNYVVTNYGRVFNVKFGKEMTQSPVTGGDLSVGMVRDGHQYRRSVRKLVARSFVEGETYICNTPMAKDGDRYNMRADNLCWRPRWFVWEYTSQFIHQFDWFFVGPVEDDYSGDVYASYWDAAVANGLLCKDVMKSVYDGSEVFPTGQRFLYISSHEKHVL
jgi:hypothetical protein